MKDELKKDKVEIADEEAGKKKGSLVKYKGIKRRLSRAMIIPILSLVLNFLVKLGAQYPPGLGYIDVPTFCLAIALYSFTLIRNIYKTKTEHTATDRDTHDTLVQYCVAAITISMVMFTLSLLSIATHSRDMQRYLSDMENISLFPWHIHVRDFVYSNLYIAVGTLEPIGIGFLIINALALFMGIFWLVWSDIKLSEYKIGRDFIS